MRVKQLLDSTKDYTISMRREFHMNPEASKLEFKTSQIIKRELEKMNIEYVSAGGTGIIADIKGNKPGKTLALRADMDALNVTELTEYEFKSQNEGFMHACGHDSHIAMLLGAAKVLNEIRDEINGTIRLIFQPAEEVGEGAFMMIEDGCLEGVDSIFGIHIWADIPTGKVSVQKGPVMAGADGFKIEVIGKGGHGSQPEQCVDAVVVSSAIVMNLQSIISREIDSRNPAVVSVGSINSGNRFNVIAEKGYLEGTVRTFDNDIRKSMPERIERIAKSTAAAYRAEVNMRYDFLVAPAINDERCASIAQSSVEKILGSDGLCNFDKLMGAEDLSHYMEHVPGALAFVGCRNEEKNCCFAHHNGRFAIDEDALSIGSNLYVQYALDFLNSNK